MVEMRHYKYKVSVRRLKGDCDEKPNYSLRISGDKEYLEATKKSWMEIVEEGLKSMRKNGEKNLVIDSESDLETSVNPQWN